MESEVMVRSGKISVGWAPGSYCAHLVSCSEEQRTQSLSGVGSKENRIKNKNSTVNNHC